MLYITHDIATARYFAEATAALCRAISSNRGRTTPPSSDDPKPSLHAAAGWRTVPNPKLGRSRVGGARLAATSRYGHTRAAAARSIRAARALRHLQGNDARPDRRCDGSMSALPPHQLRLAAARAPAYPLNRAAITRIITVEMIAATSNCLAAWRPARFRSAPPH